jgi:hypothetical protein
MNRLAYDVSLLVGTGLVTAGVAWTFGVGPALIAAGTLVIGLTIVGATLTGGKR